MNFLCSDCPLIREDIIFYASLFICRCLFSDKAILLGVLIVTYLVVLRIPEILPFYFIELRII